MHKIITQIQKEILISDKKAKSILYIVITKIWIVKQIFRMLNEMAISITINGNFDY